MASIIDTMPGKADKDLEELVSKKLNDPYEEDKEYWKSLLKHRSMKDAKDFKDSIGVAREYEERKNSKPADYPSDYQYRKSRLSPEELQELRGFLDKYGITEDELYAD